MVKVFRQRKLVIAFGVCDGLASLIGGVFASPRGDVAWLASNEFHMALGVYLIAVFILGIFQSAKSLPPPLWWTVPVALSLDNLVAPGVSPFSFSSLVLVAFASSAMSAVGFVFAAFLVAIARKRGTRHAFLGRVTP